MGRKCITLGVVAGITMSLTHSTVFAQSTATDPYGVKERSQFSPLAFNEIKPTGWLLKHAELAGTGLSGIQDILDKNVWRHSAKTRGRAGSSAWWSYEQQAYYMDGTTRLAHVLGDQNLLDSVQKTYDAVIDAQTEDGYYFTDNDTWRKGWKDGDQGDDQYRWGKTGFEGMHWSKAVFVRGVLAQYQATGDARLLELLRRHFQNYHHKGRDPGKKGKPITGHELYLNRGLVTVESMVEFLTFDNDQIIHDRAVEIFRNNEDGMVRNYLAGNFSTITHGVTYNELTKLYAAGYILTGKKEYLQAAEASYDFLQENHMQPNGVHTANEFLRGIGAFKASETCNVADFSWSNLWLLRASGNAKYADRIETCFYNAAQRMVSHDYKTHVYLQCPNHVPSIDIHHGTSKTKYIPCHKPICCARNLTRVLPNFVGHMVMKRGEGLAVLFYGPSQVSTTIGNAPISLDVETDYPFNDSVKMVFKQEAPVAFPLSVRIPAWCKNPVITVNGKTVNASADANGFAVVDRKWRRGDQVTLSLPMNVEVVLGQENRMVDAEGIRSKSARNKRHFHGDEPLMKAHGLDVDINTFERGADYAYVKRGPLTFSLPLKQTGDAAKALVVADTKASSIVSTKAIPADWAWGDEALVEIEVTLQDIDWSLESGNPQMPSKIFTADKGKMTKAKLIPYGSTDYRLTMMPVVK